MFTQNHIRVLRPNLTKLATRIETRLRMHNSTLDDASSSGARSREHLDVTSDQQRQKEIHQMKVTHIKDISPTVKKLVLTARAKPVPFHFKAGQWVDFFIPKVDVVGGFSMTSSPTYLKKTGNLELSVKYSPHPPAHWVHTECQIGSEVSIRIGGDFFLEVDSTEGGDKEKDILLIAGGVGINPLCSIIKEIVDTRSGYRTTLLFSAKTQDELLFLDKFQKMAKKVSTFKAHYFLTGKRQRTSIRDETLITRGRIGVGNILEVLDNDFHLIQDDFGKVQTYICGPAPMIKNVEIMLKSIGIRNIFYENWWISTTETQSKND